MCPKVTYAVNVTHLFDTPISEEFEVGQTASRTQSFHKIEIVKKY